MPITNLLIRPYSETDEAGVTSLWSAAFPDEPAKNVPIEDIRRKLAVQRDLFLVGQLDGRIVATVMAGFDGHRGWVYRVAVLPDLQKRGIGQAMMRPRRSWSRSAAPKSTFKFAQPTTAWLPSIAA